jgi:hypothetical protein
MFTCLVKLVNNVPYVPSEGVCGPGWGLAQGTVADESGAVGCVCGAGTLFRIARSNQSLDLYRLISRTAEYGPVRSVMWEGGRCEASSLSRLARSVNGQTYLLVQALKRRTTTSSPTSMAIRSSPTSSGPE